MQEIKKDEEYVQISEPVIFEGKKFVILDLDPSTPNIISSSLFLIVYPLIGLACYKIYFAVITFGIFRTIFWFMILFFSLRLRLGILTNQEHIINKISILEDGKTCEIKTMKNVFKIDINTIRKINMEEAIFMAERLESIKVSYIPIVIDTKLYLIPIKSRIHRKDFLGNICEGRYLKFQEIIHKDRTIQI